MTDRLTAIPVVLPMRPHSHTRPYWIRSGTRPTGNYARPWWLCWAKSIMTSQSIEIVQILYILHQSTSIRCRIFRQTQILRTMQGALPRSSAIQISLLVQFSSVWKAIPSERRSSSSDKPAMTQELFGCTFGKLQVNINKLYSLSWYKKWIK